MRHGLSRGFTPCFLHQNSHLLLQSFKTQLQLHCRVQYTWRCPISHKAWITFWQVHKTIQTEMQTIMVEFMKWGTRKLQPLVSNIICYIQTGIVYIFFILVLYHDLVCSCQSPAFVNVGSQVTHLGVTSWNNFSDSTTWIKNITATVLSNGLFPFYVT